MKLVRVTWHDTHSIDPWTEIPTAYAVREIVSVGFIKEFNDGVVLVANWDQENGYGFGIAHIPRGCIVSIEPL